MWGLSNQSRYVFWVSLFGVVGLLILPWYGISEGFWSFAWPASLNQPGKSPALFEAIKGRWWLWPIIVLALLPLVYFLRGASGGTFLVWIGAGGLAALALQGFLIGLKGWTVSFADILLGPAAPQPGMGAGAFVVGSVFLFVLSAGLALKGLMRGDIFLVTSISAVVGSIALFVFYPVALVLIEAAIDADGSYSLSSFFWRFMSYDLWKAFWNSLLLAVAVGLTTTLLGLAFALLHKRTDFRAKGLLRLLAILPIITPPFVIGLGIILLFGRNGTATWFMSQYLGIPPSRWIYGFFGLMLVQTLAFAPITYLVILGVVEGISPSMEEAARTLRADRWQTFQTVTWPLMRPGLANAFLIGFVESLADFGNPLVLGGNYDVLSTDIFFAIVGAQNDPGRAAALSIALLVLTLSAFVLQRQWIGRKVYTTISGKGDSGRAAPLPHGVKRLVYATTMPWLAFTIILYGLILAGGFVKSLGINNTPTLQHYVTAFGIEWTEHGLLWSGRAWPSFFTTIELAALAAPITAAIGLLTAYLLNRQKFIGQAAFEFITMLSFAIPGTVIGVSYIIAFNVPPIELTGTGLILIICFVFRNMPVSIRAGIAAMSQIDKSLDECSLLLRHGSFATIRRVILPLLRPAIVASLVYSFVRAITSVSAVIFLVSAQYNLATSYIVGRVEVSDFGVAIAYSSVLIVFMFAAIGLIQFGVGEQRRAARTVQPLERRMTILSRSAPVYLKGVSKVFGLVAAVDAIDLTIEAGTLVTLLGPSGCGKTTTLRMIAGLESPSSGQVFIGNKDVTLLPPNERDVSMVFQSYALFPHMTVIENVSYGLRRSALTRRAQTDKAHEGLRLVGLEGYDARLPSELSGGQQQRVAVARALVLEPQVLLFDEPLSNLDAKLRRRMREDIRDIQSRLGLTSVYVTHDQEEALAVSDKIVVMNKGRIAQQGTPADLYERPADAFVADFIGSANLIPAEIVARDQERKTVTVQVGDVKLDLPGSGQQSDVYLVVRPNAVIIEANGLKGASFEARVEKATYLGSHWEYTLRLGDWPVFVIQPLSAVFKTGSKVRVRFMEEQVALVARS